jgi:hypothetical protein
MLNRRELLIERMNFLEASGMDCKGCAGTCCTFEANSMMVTPLEAWELMTFLKTQNQNSDELKKKCEETVRFYRLDHQMGNGKRSYLRRTYTCPFFHHQELGCPLPREVKPYGCLAFNSHHATEKAARHCYSETELLLKRDQAHDEEVNWNEVIKKQLNLIWDKSPLPLALLDLWDRDLNVVDLK